MASRLASRSLASSVKPALIVKPRTRSCIVMVQAVNAQQDEVSMTRLQSLLRPSLSHLPTSPTLVSCTPISITLMSFPSNRHTAKYAPSWRRSQHCLVSAACLVGMSWCVLGLISSDLSNCISLFQFIVHNYDVNIAVIVIKFWMYLENQMCFPV